MIQQSPSERRQSIRAKRILSIQYRIVKTRAQTADRSWQLSTTHDMSLAGLSFLSDIPLHIDDVIELNVVMSGILDIFKGHGKVVRVEKKETGAFYLAAIKFVEYKRSFRKREPKTARRPAAESPGGPARHSSVTGCP